MKKLLIFLLACCSFAQASLNVSDVVIVSNNDNTKKARIIIEDFLVICDIIVYKDGGYKLPSYLYKQEIEYFNIKVLNRDLERNIFNALSSNKISYNPNKDKICFNIVDFEAIKNSKYRKCNVNIKFNNEILVTCGIMQSNKSEYWISWPYIKDKDKNGNKVFRNTVYILDKNLKQKVEKSILNAYFLFRKKESMQRKI